ncbi:hypothetical protein bcgnr5390_11660 [Bacillus luti]|nr:hypothetical protein BC2903_29250 [Bacillus cereus]
MSYCSICKKDTDGQSFIIPTVVPFLKEGEITKWVESSERCVSCVECKNFKSQILNPDPESANTYK